MRLIQGDITSIHADAIVNAANSSLMGGGGVDGAIHRKGGPQILEDCRSIVARQGKCNVGEAVYTRAGNLPAKFVIHTVGPVWNGGVKSESTLLANAYQNSLKLALELNVGSIAFPNISTGIYRYPKKEAAEVAIEACKQVLSETDGVQLDITFVCFDQENFEIYADLLSG